MKGRECAKQSLHYKARVRAKGSSRQQLIVAKEDEMDPPDEVSSMSLYSPLLVFLLHL